VLAIIDIPAAVADNTRFGETGFRMPIGSRGWRGTIVMPRRELSSPQQVVDWLEEWGQLLGEPASMTLIGSAALLWHAADRGQ
jgi:hypothetical protein